MKRTLIVRRGRDSQPENGRSYVEWVKTRKGLSCPNLGSYFYRKRKLRSRGIKFHVNILLKKFSQQGW